MNGGNKEIVSPIRTYDFEMVCGAVEKKDYPSEYELPRDQSSVGFAKVQTTDCCVGCAIAQIAEAIYASKLGEIKEMSEDFAYGALRPETSRYTGMVITSALDYWRKIGIVSKDDFNIVKEMPELRDLIDKCPELYDLAKNNIIGGYSSINYADREKRDLAIKQALSQPNPLPLIVSVKMIGENHCLLVTGWNDEKNTYKFKNSWGDSGSNKTFLEMSKDKIKEVYVIMPGSIELPFTDVPKDAWYYKYVKNMYFNGFMKGVSETEFEPERPMTRAEVAALMYNVIKAVDGRFSVLNEILDEKIDKDA